MGVLRMGYVHERVTDPEEAKQHHGSTMGLYETRAGYKVADPDDIEIYEKRAEQFGCTVQRMTAGENSEVSDSVRITLPSMHQLELYHDMTLVGTESGTSTRTSSRGTSSASAPPALSMRCRPPTM